MERRALRGLPWTFLSYGASKLMMLGSTVVLARLLVPSDFGLVALALLLLGYATILQDFGLTATLVARPDLDARARGTILAMLLVTSTAMAILIAALSPLIADLFGQPRLAGVIAVMALTVVTLSL